MKHLTIGQFAALHGINKKTLMWYDQIGLFSPACVDPQNGYRYYNYHQSALLETILLLRELDVSVGEIQEFMQGRCAVSLHDLLTGKIKELDTKIDHLKAVRTTLCSHQQNMETLLHMDLSRIALVEKEESCLVTVKINEKTSYDQQVEIITRETRKYRLHRLHDAAYGTMISVESLRRGAYDAYSRLFIELPFSLPQKGLHIRPGGRYLTAFYQGDFEKMPARYEEIFSFAKARGISLHGYSYEKILNETVADRMEDYIVQIEIPAGSP